MFARIPALTLAALLTCTAAIAQEVPEKKEDRTMRDVGTVVSQPGRDVGIVRTKIPPILEEAARDPYTLRGAATCAQLSAEVVRLNEVLGPDYTVDGERPKAKPDYAKAGGNVVAGLLIPFRGLVREVTGAAPAERRLAAAIDAGFARRGFLRGTHTARKCKTGF